MATLQREKNYQKKYCQSRVLFIPFVILPTCQGLQEYGCREMTFPTCRRLQGYGCREMTFPTCQGLQGYR